jgi:hypothetical protein
MTGSQSEQIKKEQNQIKRIIWLININVVLFFNGYIILEKIRLDTQLKFYLFLLLDLTIVGLTYLIFLFLRNIPKSKLDNEAQQSFSNRPMVRWLRNWKFHWVEIYIIWWQKTQVETLALIDGLIERKHDLSSREEAVNTLHQRSRHQSSFYKIAWKRWRQIRDYGIGYSLLLLMAIAYACWANPSQAWVYILGFILVLGLPFIRKKRDVLWLNRIFNIIDSPKGVRLVALGVFVYFIVVLSRLNYHQQRDLLLALYIGLIAPLYLSIAVKNLPYIDVAIRGAEGEKETANYLKENGYSSQSNLKYPKQFLRTENHPISRFCKTWILRLEKFIPEQLLYQGDIDFFLSGYPLQKSLTLVLDIKAEEGQIKIHQKTQNLGIKRPKKSLKSFPGQIPPEHKIKEQANWLKIKKKLKVAPVPVIVFTKATIALPEEYRNAEGFYCFKGTWLVSLNDLKRFLEYLNSKIITD